MILLNPYLLDAERIDSKPVNAIAWLLILQQQQQQQHLFRISRLHTEFYNFLYKWILADLNLAN